MMPVLYILARNDLVSLNPGKLAAQACHAANMAQGIIQNMIDGPEIQAGEDFHRPRNHDILIDMWREWAGDRLFGTTIVLETPAPFLDRIKATVSPGLYNWEDNRPLIFGVVTDPSYPVRDGAITHLVPLITCGFVFGNKDGHAVNSITGNLKLYP